MNQRHTPKNRRKERDRPIPYQIHRYRENFALSWLGSIFLHLVFFAILFFLPLPYDNIPPSITLEMWEPEEEPALEAEEEMPNKESMPYVGQLSYVTSRYRDLKYHPQAKNPAPETVPKPVPSGRTGLSVPRARNLAPSVKESVAGPVLADVPPSPQETVPEDEEIVAEEMLPTLEEAVQAYQDEYVSPSDEEILGPELSGILESDGGAQWLGDTLMNLQMSKRSLVTPPDLNFLTQEGFTSNIKVVKIRLTISPDGTVSDAVIIFPGTGNPELDRRLRLAFLRVVFNDVRSFGREEETGTIVLNFKG